MVPSTKQSQPLSCNVPAGPTRSNPSGERVHSSGTHKDGAAFLGSGKNRVLGSKAVKLALLACLCTQALLPAPVFAQMSNIDLATNFTSSRGFSVIGAAAGDYSGTSVASAGDVNKDGYDDVIIGAYDASPNGRTNAGTSYVIYGGSSLGPIDLSVPLTSTQGFIVTGAAASDQSGSSVASAGDMNKDGYGDVIIGAPVAFPSGRIHAGTSYVIYGGAGSVTTSTTTKPTTTTTSSTSTTAVPTTTTSTTTTKPTTSTTSSTTTTPTSTTQPTTSTTSSTSTSTTSTSTTTRPTTTSSTTVTPATTTAQPTISSTSSTPVAVPTTTTSTLTIQPATSTISLTSTTTSLTSSASTMATLATQPSSTRATSSPSTTTLPTTTSTSISTPTMAAPIATSSTEISTASSATTVSEAQPTSAASSSSVTTTSSSTSTTMIAAPTTTSSTETTNESSASYTAMSTDTTAGALRTSEKPSTMVSPSSTPQSTTTSPLMTAPSSISNITSTTPYNATLQSGGRTTSTSSSWTGIIVGATIGAVAIIGTGYLAYRKWRGHGKGIAPQTKGAAIAAMNAMDSAREGDEGRIQTNPVYEENHLQQAAGIYERAQVNPAYEDVSRQALRAYEVPHIDTWDRQAYDAVEQNDGVSITKLAAKTIRAAYDTILPPENSELLTSQNTAYYDIAEPEEQMVHQIMRTTYDVLDVTMESRRAYEAPHVTTWSPQSYDFVDGSYRPPAYEIVLAPQKPWNSEGYETGPFSVSDL